MARGVKRKFGHGDCNCTGAVGGGAAREAWAGGLGHSHDAFGVGFGTVQAHNGQGSLASTFSGWPGDNSSGAAAAGGIRDGVGTGVGVGSTADVGVGVNVDIEGIDFMEPDLCNILLSEGIPCAFV
ncbi:hypothetical protein BDW74DRAFT_176733 [Aspergillus multicolor]|uniref:uncharacterized protein n=1 Tax=Aspergillus multicolor TaxID=41759 RepID=UPI003CCD647B